MGSGEVFRNFGFAALAIDCKQPVSTHETSKKHGQQNAGASRFRKKGNLYLGAQFNPIVLRGLAGAFFLSRPVGPCEVSVRKFAADPRAELKRGDMRAFRGEESR